MSTSYSPKIITDGLVLCVDAANPKSYISGSSLVYDLSNYDNNGTLINGPTFDTGSKGSIVFNGSNGYIRTNNSLSFSSGNFSISFWMYMTDSDTQYIFSKYTLSGVTYLGLYVSYLSNIFIVYAKTNNLDTFASINLAAFNNFSLQNKWKHITFTWSYASSYCNMLFYADGIWMSSHITGIPLNVSDDFIIGADKDGANGLGGKIANMMVYNRTLSAAEVLQNYNALRGRFGI